MGFAVTMIFVLRDDQERVCLRAFSAHRWDDAIRACQRESELSGDAWLGVAAAHASFNADKPDDALAIATRWFGSAADASARQIAGEIHLRLGEPSLGQPQLERALSAHLAAEDHTEAAHDAELLAGTLMGQERLGPALEAAQLGVREAARSGDAFVAIKTRLALGAIFAEIGDATQAARMYWQAAGYAPQLPAEQAWVYLQLGTLECDTGRLERGVRLLELALELARIHAIPRVANAALLYLARAQRDLGNIATAEAKLREVDPGVRSASSARLVTGLIAADRGDRAQSEQLLELAAAEPSDDDYAAEIALQRGRLADRAGQRNTAETFYRQAVEFVEKLRQESSLELRPWVLTHRREPYGALLMLLAQADRDSSRDEALVVAERLHARTWYDALLAHAGPKDSAALIAGVQQLGHELYGVAAPPVSLERLRSLLAHREALLFSDTGTEIWRFHVVDGAVVRLDRLPSDVPRLVEQWRSAPNDLGLADQLGAMLVPASVHDLSSRSLYIVADGALASLPFSAIRNAGHYLVETRVIVRLPGVVALQCRKNSNASQSVLFLGDSRGDLPAARAEALELAQGSGGRGFVGNEVTRDRLMSARNASLLHLAIHADEEANGPSLLLETGSASSADVVAMGLAPRLAVLAGCATAVSRDIEGWDALTSAFLVAGTQTVVATLRSVRDTDASVILRRFYSLGGRTRPAVALTMAQRELIASNDLTTWAPFVTYGSADEADCEPAEDAAAHLPFGTDKR